MTIGEKITDIYRILIPIPTTFLLANKIKPCIPEGSEETYIWNGGNEWSHYLAVNVRYPVPVESLIRKLPKEQKRQTILRDVEKKLREETSIKPEIINHLIYKNRFKNLISVEFYATEEKN